MNYNLFEEKKKTLMLLSIMTISAFIGVKIIIDVGSAVPVEEVKEKIQESKKQKNNKKIIQNKKNNTQEDDNLKKKNNIQKDDDLKKAYIDLPNTITFKNKTIYLSIDNNGKPCYINNGKFINSDGIEIPNNYLPFNKTCANAKVVKVGNENVLKISSLDSLNTLKPLPIGYKFYIKGEGLDLVIENCGKFWSDKCYDIPKAKILISMGGPEDLPKTTSEKTKILTKRGDELSVSLPSTPYKYNANYYEWKKINFKSMYASGDLVDGEFVKDAEEMYKKQPKVAIVKKYKQVFTRIDNQNGVCYFNDNGNPVNNLGDEVKIKDLPNGFKCKDLKPYNGFLLLDTIYDIFKFDKNEKGEKVAVNLNGQKYIVENCGNFWSEDCEKEFSKIYISKKDRTVFPRPGKGNSIYLSKEKGKSKTNTKNGIILSDGTYVWEKANVNYSQNGLLDIPHCKYSCYGENLDSATYAKTSSNIFVKRTNRNDIEFWTSIDEKNVLSPTKNQFAYNVKIDKLDGYTNTGVLFYKLPQKYNYFDAKEKCSELGMFLPSVEQTVAENSIGISNSSWAWADNRIDNETGQLWKENSIQKENVNEKHDVICIY